MGEWHLVFRKAFQEIKFGLVPWFHEAVVGFGSAFPSPRFKSVGPIRDSVLRDRIEEVLVEHPAECRVAFTFQGDHWLKGFECLDRSLEADRAWFETMSRRGLGHDRADEVVSQDMRPEFLSDKFRRLASQDVHLQRLF